MQLIFSPARTLPTMPKYKKYYAKKLWIHCGRINSCAPIVWWNCVNCWRNWVRWPDWRAKKKIPKNFWIACWLKLWRPNHFWNSIRAKMHFTISCLSKRMSVSRCRPYSNCSSKVFWLRTLNWRRCRLVWSSKCRDSVKTSKCIHAFCHRKCSTWPMSLKDVSVISH